MVRRFYRLRGRRLPLLFEETAEPEFQVVEVHDTLRVLEGRILHLEAGPVEAKVVELLDVLLNLHEESVVLWEAN